MPFTYVIDLYTMVAKFTYAYSGQRISANVVLPDCRGSNTATTGYPFRASRNVLSRFPAIIILSIRLMPSLFLELLFLSLSYYSIQGVIFKLNHGFTPEFGIFRKPPYTRFHNHATLKKTSSSKHLRPIHLQKSLGIFPHVHQTGLQFAFPVHDAAKIINTPVANGRQNAGRFVRTAAAMAVKKIPFRLVRQRRYLHFFFRRLDGFGSAEQESRPEYAP